MEGAVKEYDVRRSFYSIHSPDWTEHLAVFVIYNPTNPDIDVYYFETLGM